MVKVKIDIKDSSAHIRWQDALTSGMVGAKVEFNFEAADEAWNGLAKCAVFKHGDITRVVANITDYVTIPWKVIRFAGVPISIGVYGTNEKGSVVVPTVWATTNPVQDSPDPNEDEGTHPDPEVWAQMQAKIDGLKSGYDVAVANGFKGTEDEWLESLNGNDGASIHPLTGGEFNDLALNHNLVPGDLYLITKDDDNDDYVKKGNIYKAKDNVNFSYQMNIIGEKGKAGQSYILTDADKEEISGQAVSYMELGVTNLALDTSTDWKSIVCDKGKLTSIPHNIGGSSAYVHILEDIGGYSGGWITYAAVLEAAGADIRLLVRALPATFDHNIYTKELQSTQLNDSAAGIKEAYDAGNSNWRYEAVSTAYQFRPGGNNNFQYTTKSLQFTSAAGQWIAIRIKSPGEDKYNITFNHGVNNIGANKGSVYIIPATEVDAYINGTYGDGLADTYAQEMSDNPYQDNGATVAFDAFRAAITELLGNATSIMTPCYYAAEPGVSKTTGEYTFEADKEYVMVFTSDENSPTSPKKGNVYIGSFEAVLPKYDFHTDFTSAEYIADGNVGRSSVSLQIPEGCGKLALYVESTNNTSNQTVHYYKCLKIELGNVPTGWSPAPVGIIDYIVERKSSGIWTAERWASGKAICWARTVFENVYLNNPNEVPGLYAGTLPAQQYPYKFDEPPLVFVSAPSSGFEYVSCEASSTGALGHMYVFSMLPDEDATVPISIYVIGKVTE